MISKRALKLYIDHAVRNYLDDNVLSNDVSYNLVRKLFQEADDIEHTQDVPKFYGLVRNSLLRLFSKSTEEIRASLPAILESLTKILYGLDSYKYDRVHNRLVLLKRHMEKAIRVINNLL